MTQGSFDWDSIPTNNKKKNEPLDKQKGTRFDPPEKEVKQTKKQKERIKAITETAKKLKKKINKEDQDKLKEFDSAVGVNKKDLTLSYLDTAIDKALALVEQLREIKNEAKSNAK